MLARLEDSVLIVIDMQPSFLDGVWHHNEILQRSKFIVECANLLGVPIVATEQNRERMGGTEESLTVLTGKQAIDKMTFSCCGSSPFNDRLKSLRKNQAIIVGIETHICINQTAHHLVESGYEAIVCSDAVSSRTEDRHKIGLKRLHDFGTSIAHTESVVYEWMESANHPKFRDVLAYVKRYSS